tara:strand:- start:153 stop:266 length:114 start_codon:yes stop_codon:yes gene_type:complete
MVVEEAVEQGGREIGRFGRAHLTFKAEKVFVSNDSDA